jgi:hypothetical protein
MLILISYIIVAGGNMKKLCFLIFLCVISILTADIDRSCTHKNFPNLSDSGESAKIGKHVKQVTHEEYLSRENSREGWETADSIYIDKFLPAGNYLGVMFDNNDNVLHKVTDMPSLSQNAKSAVRKAPAWIRPELEFKLSLLDTENQNRWANTILEAVDPYIDEIAFSIAHLSAEYLMSEFSKPEMIIENAELIYTIDQDLSYVEVIDYGSSADDSWYSTTKYKKRNPNGSIVYREVPNEIYYWNIVHPKITDEIPAYIDPEVIESNSTHANNIVDSNSGYFWRNFLYNHNDPGYPKLKYYLQSVDIANDNTFSLETAIGKMERWISETMEFTSNYERPHQPVRIYRKHIGRCGEHADLRCAVSRIGLIPAQSVLTISGDHTWNEIWDEDWVHWDGGSINNPMLYENGWGRHYGSIFSIRSDGLLQSVSDVYSDDHATLNIYIVDSEENPIDGALVKLGVMYDGNLRFDNCSYTNEQGKATFIVGEERDYYATAITPLGNVSDGNMVHLIDNVDVNYEGDFTLTIDGNNTVPQIYYTNGEINSDDIDDFRINTEFEVVNNVVYGPVLMDDMDNTNLFWQTPQGKINFMQMDDTNFNQFSVGNACSNFNSQIGATVGNIDYDLPEVGNFYTVFENRFSIRNAQHVRGYIKLLQYNEQNGTATISGNIYDAFTYEPIANASISTVEGSTISDASGSFTMTVYPGDKELFICHDNYQPMVVEVLGLIAGDSESLTIVLTELSQVPENVIAVVNGNNAEINWENPQTQIRLRNVRSNDRSVTNYSVFRGIVDDMYEIQWLELNSNVSENNFIDTGWNDLADGTYVYGVKSHYTTGEASAIEKSNYLYKNMHVTVDFTVHTNCGDSPEGAVIEFICNDGNPLHNYTYDLDESGEISINNTWKGVYSLRVSLANFSEYFEENIDLSEDEEFIISLNELRTKPQMVCVIDNVISWQAVPADRSFEDYKIYIDDMENPIAVTDQTEFIITSATTGEHVVGVQAFYTSGSSDIVTLSYLDGNSINSNILLDFSFEGNVENSASEWEAYVSGELSYGVGINGQCIIGDGTDDYVQVDSLFNIPPTSFSISWWMKPESTTNWNQQIRSVNGWDSFNFHTTEDGSIYTGINTGTRFTPNHLGHGNVNISEWQYFTFTFDEGMGRMYKNGAMIGEKTGMTMPQSWGGFRIGNDNTNTFHGSIDELELWDRAVATKEIQYLYEENVQLFGTISGIVKNAETNETLEGALISAGMYSGLSNSDGEYSFDLAGALYDHVTCELDGYEISDEVDILIDDEGTLTLNFDLHPLVGNEQTDQPEYVNNFRSIYPNPFYANTRANVSIAFSIEKSDTHVELSIYNVKGQKVKSLLNDKLDAGNHTINWNGKNDSSKELASGIYFLRMRNGRFTSSKKMILLK